MSAVAEAEAVVRGTGLRIILTGAAAALAALARRLDSEAPPLDAETRAHLDRLVDAVGHLTGTLEGARR